MCGIYCIWGRSTAPDGHMKLAKRGPDHMRVFERHSVPLAMVFHRLRINGDTPEAMQPFHSDRWALMCNGEIFNHKELGDTPSGSDCEVLLKLLDEEPNIGDICCTIDAEFAFVVYDKLLNRIIAARDPYGVRPLFIGRGAHGEIVWSSEMKAMTDVCTENIEQFKPGYIMEFDCESGKILEYRSCQSDNVRRALVHAVEKRIQPGQTCCLLSGGLDSSLVASIAQRAMGSEQLHTFSIGLPGSPDLIWAAKVAAHIGSKHHEVNVTEKEFLQVIPKVIETIESWDCTTVRASVGNYLVAKYIRDHTNFRVVLNGDYADEVCGGYLYLKNAPTFGEFVMENHNLLNNIHKFDSLRSDRCISAHGLEARAPFADKRFVELYMSLDPRLTSPANRMEKWFLRRAFMGTNLLPTDVILRSKEAFSDGVSPVTRSWSDVIQEWLGGVSERQYYKNIFIELFGKQHLNVVPEDGWMPKWAPETNDPSARTMKRYLTDYQVCLLSGILITVWPLTTNGNFFNNWLMIAYSLPVGFYLQSIYSKKKVKKVKK